MNKYFSPGISISWLYSEPWKPCSHLEYSARLSGGFSCPATLSLMLLLMPRTCLSNSCKNKARKEIRSRGREEARKGEERKCWRRKGRREEKWRGQERIREESRREEKRGHSWHFSPPNPFLFK